MSIDKRITFEERYDSEDYNTTTLYFVADTSLLKELVGDKYPEADGMTISIEYPISCIESSTASANASVEISPYINNEDTTEDYDWIDIDLPYSEIEALVSLALS